jgi:catechol 2,3-dioxygenase-like lactoylglutathione lyase family enzyme
VFLPPADTRGVFLFVIEHRSPPDMLPLARATAEAPISGIDHVVITSGGPDGAIALYRDRLGIRLALDRTFEAWGMRLVFFRIAGITVEIAHPLQGSTPTEVDRLWGISWRVPDVEAARRRLEAGGFDVSDVRSGRRPGTRVCTVRSGTNGVATLLIGPE